MALITIDQLGIANSQFYWPLNDVAGTTAVAGKGGVNATRSGTTDLTLGGGSFPGDSETVLAATVGQQTSIFKAPIFPTFNPGTGSFTFFYFFKTSVSTGVQVFCGTNDSGAGFYSDINETGAGKISFTTNAANQITASGTWADGNWHFVACIRDASNNLRIRIDKVDRANVAQVGGGTVNNTTGNTNWGIGNFAPTFSFSINGSLAKVGVTTGVITDTELDFMYDVGIAAFDTYLPSENNLMFSPNNWDTDGVGSVQSNNVLSDATFARSNNPGAYIKVAANTSSNIKYIFDVSSLATLTAGNCPVLNYRKDSDAYSTVQLATGGTQVVSVTGTTSEVVFKSVDLNTPGDRWNTPLSCVKLRGVQIPKTSTLTLATRKTQNILFYGDSITETQNATGSNALVTDNDATLGTAWLLAQALNMDICIAGYAAQGYSTGGTGNVNNFPNAQAFFSSGRSRLIAGLYRTLPNIICIWHGKNGSALSATVASTLTTIRTQAPNAIILQMVPADQTNVSGITSGYTTYIAASGDARCFLIDLGVNYVDLLTSNDNPALHPNYRGHGILSNKFVNAISNQLSKGITSIG